VTGAVTGAPVTGAPVTGAPVTGALYRRRGLDRHNFRQVVAIAPR
jgi:hypothetical protein